VAIARNWVKLALFFTPVRINDTTLGIVSDLLNAMDVNQHVPNGIHLTGPGQLGVIVSMADAPIRWHRQKIVRVRCGGNHTSPSLQGQEYG